MSLVPALCQLPRQSGHVHLHRGQRPASVRLQAKRLKPPRSCRAPAQGFAGSFPLTQVDVSKGTATNLSAQPVAAGYADVKGHTMCEGPCCSKEPASQARGGGLITPGPRLLARSHQEASNQQFACGRASPPLSPIHAARAAQSDPCRVGASW